MHTGAPLNSITMRWQENSYVLSRIITCIKLCRKCETALQGHDSLNPGICWCIFKTMCEGNSRLHRHYDTQLIFKGTSTTVQNKLLDLMYELYRDEVDTNKWTIYHLLLYRQIRQRMSFVNNKWWLCCHTCCLTIKFERLLEFFMSKTKLHFLIVSRVYWNYWMMMVQL